MMSLAVPQEALLMSTYTLCFYGETSKIANNHPDEATVPLPKV